MSVDSRVVNASEEVDAMVFSGDGLYDQESLDEFKKYLKSWNGAIDGIQKSINELNKEKGGL